MVSQVDLIKKDIVKGLAKGATASIDEYGKSIGPECDHCGKTGIEFVAVRVVPKGEDGDDDWGRWVIGMFGTTCIKSTGIKELISEKKSTVKKIKKATKKKATAKPKKPSPGRRGWWTLTTEGSDSKGHLELDDDTLRHIGRMITQGNTSGEIIQDE